MIKKKANSHVYRVEYTKTERGEIFVKASSKKEAIKKADDHLYGAEIDEDGVEIADGDTAVIYK